MTRTKKLSLIVLFVVFVTALFTLTACFGVGDEGGGGGGGGGAPKTITISIDETAEVGASVLLEKSANFSPFLQDNIKYEFTANTCDASFSHSKKNNYWYTYVTADKPGEATIKLSYVENGETVAVSNTVTITFYANTINTVEDLKGIAQSDKTFVLGADIDLSSESNWAPISGFKGTLIGDGYKITNLTISDRTTASNLGLFGVLEGTVKDLTIENANIAARGNAGIAGIVAGTNKGTIDNVTVSGTISIDYYDSVGGIAGFNDLGYITNCTNKATVSGSNKVGGIVGEGCIQGEYITQNVNEGDVSGKESVGGVVGYLTCKDRKNTTKYTYTFTDNTNEGDVSGTTSVGGVIGNSQPLRNSYYSSYYNNYIELSLLTNNGAVTATGDNVGGVLGNSIRTPIITVSENNGDVTGRNYVGGLVGNAPSLEIKAAGMPNRNKIEGNAYVGGFAGYAGIIHDASNVGQVVSNGVIVESGQANSYVGGIAGYCTGLIDCENNSSITVTVAGCYVGGLGGYVSIGANDRMTGNRNVGDITGFDSTGGIVGYLTIPDFGDTDKRTFNVTDNENSGNISGTTKVGGLFGSSEPNRNKYYSSYYDNYFAMSLLTNSGVVIASGDYVGGIIGYGVRNATLAVGENSANITGKNYVGGLVGYSSLLNIKATGFTNTNIITGYGYVGGIAGYAGLVEDAKNNGQVISLGAIAESSNSCAYVGGVVGYCRGILNCENYSAITVNHGGDYVGGVAGYVYVNKNDLFDGNVNTGNVTTNCNNVGGVAGYVFSPDFADTTSRTFTLTGSSNSGTVIGNTYVGGIIGYVNAKDSVYYSTHYYNYMQVTYCQNTGTVQGNSGVGGIVGYHYHLKTDADLMNTNSTTSGSLIGSN